MTKLNQIMKNKLTILLFALGFIGFTFAQEQVENQEEVVHLRNKVAIGFNIGVNTGGSTANDLYSTVLGIDFTFLKGITKNVMLGGNAAMGNAFSRKDVSDSDLDIYYLEDQQEFILTMKSFLSE